MFSALLLSVGTLVRWNTLDSDLATSLQTHLSDTLFVAGAYIPLESIIYMGRYREIMDKYLLPLIVVMLSAFGIYRSTVLVLRTIEAQSLSQTEKKYGVMLIVCSVIVTGFVLSFLYDIYQTV